MSTVIRYFPPRIEYVDALGDVKRLGPRHDDAPLTVTIGSDVDSVPTFSIADAGTQVLWDAADSAPGPGDFDLIWIESTQDILLEIRVDDGNNNGEVNLTLTVKANKPFYLFSDDALAADGSAGAFDGTADLIEKITAHNSSGSTAVVKCGVFT